MIIFEYWQFYLFLGYVSSVVFLQSYKMAVREAKNNGAATILLQLVASGVFLLFVPFFEMKFPSGWKWYALLALASVFYAFNDRAQTTVRKNLEVSEYTILNQLRTVALIVIGVLVFRETLLWNKVVGAALILAANALVVFRKHDFKINRYVWIAMAAALAGAIGLSIDVGVSDHFNLPIYILITFLIPIFMVMIGERISLSSALAEFEEKSGRYYLLTGAAWAVNSICFIRALQLGTVTVVAPLLAVTVLLNVVFAAIIHKESKDLWKKLLAACLTVLGMWLIV